MLREEKRQARRKVGAERNIRPEDQVMLCRNSSVRQPTAHALEMPENKDDEQKLIYLREFS